MKNPEISIKLVSTTNTVPDTTWNYVPLPSYGNKGWTCPKCGRVNAPWVDHCPCTPGPTWVQPQQPYTYVYIDNEPSIIGPWI